MDLRAFQRKKQSVTAPTWRSTAGGGGQSVPQSASGDRKSSIAEVSADSTSVVFWASLPRARSWTASSRSMSCGTRSLASSAPRKNCSFQLSVLPGLPTASVQAEASAVAASFAGFPGFEISDRKHSLGLQIHGVQQVPVNTLVEGTLGHLDAVWKESAWILNGKFVVFWIICS